MYYKAGRPSHKWWRYVFWFLVNVSITNAWILFNESGQAQNYTHVKFCTELADRLRGNFRSRKQRPTQSPPHLVLLQVNGHSLIRIEGRSRVCRVCLKRGIKTSKERINVRVRELQSCTVSRSVLFRFSHPRVNVLTGFYLTVVML